MFFSLFNKIVMMLREIMATQFVDSAGLVAGSPNSFGRWTSFYRQLSSLSWNMLAQNTLKIVFCILSMLGVMIGLRLCETEPLVSSKII
jgi:hypothetical protein